MENIIKFGDRIKYEQLFKKPKQGASTGGVLFDRATGGAIKGSVCLYCMPTGQGKTRTGVGIACNLIREGLSVAYLTFEQRPEDIAELVLKNFQEDGETYGEVYDRLKELPLFIYQFRNDSVESVTNAVKAVKPFDAVIVDYLALPDDQVPEAYSASVVAKRMAYTMKNTAEKHNQFFFVMAQAKPKKKGDEEKFSTIDDIWISKTMPNPVDVCIIANKVDKSLINIDIVKNRSRKWNHVRIRREMEYETCRFTDISWEYENGEEVNDYGEER